MIENKISNHSKEMINKKNTFLKCLGVFVFVAIPLPLTGVWTGCCVAVAIGLDYWQAVASVFFGNIVAGLIIYFVCSIFPNFTTYLFYIILGIIIVSIVISLIRKVFIKKYSTDK